MDAEIPNRAKCTFRDCIPPNTQRPKIAEIVVSRDPSSPIHAPSGDSRRFSGISIVAQTVTAYNSKGNSNCRHHSFSFRPEYSSPPAQTRPTKNPPPPRPNP